MSDPVGSGTPIADLEAKLAMTQSNLLETDRKYVLLRGLVRRMVTVWYQARGMNLLRDMQTLIEEGQEATR